MLYKIRSPTSHLLLFLVPRLGPDDRKTFAVTPEADVTYRSTIGPVLSDIEPDEIWDSRPNWLPVWSHDELSQMQRDNENIRFILENKLEGQKPSPARNTSDKSFCESSLVIDI